VSQGVVAWGPAAAWAAFLFYLSSRSSVGIPLPHGLDKAAHLFAYLVLGAFLAHAAARIRFSPAFAVLIGWAYGVFDEIHQSFVPGRNADALDWVADAVGVVLGVVLYFAVLRYREADPADVSPAETTST
jgi:VanZ family protein